MLKIISNPTYSIFLFIGENLKPIRSTPLSDVIFLAYSTKCMKLCRAKIVETINRSEFKCIFIDLGFYEQISLTDIYELPKYLALHKVSFKVKTIK